MSGAGPRGGRPRSRSPSDTTHGCDTVGHVEVVIAVVEILVIAVVDLILVEAVVGVVRVVAWAVPLDAPLPPDRQLLEDVEQDKLPGVAVRPVRAQRFDGRRPVVGPYRL